MKSTVQTAFSRQAPHFDAEDEANPILQYMRGHAREAVTRLIAPGQSILELNAGTGLDALYFAQKGYQVLATDTAEGMINQLQEKSGKSSAKGNLELKALDFRELGELGSRKFDLIFSNFGGLNCIPDLEVVFRHFPILLKPGGYVVLIIMPPVCPLEMANAFRGKFKLAFRRLLPGGGKACLGDTYFNTWYFAPSDVEKAMPAGFERHELKGLGSLVPQPHMQNFPKQFPKLFEWLKRTESRINHCYPFNRWADHFLITFKWNGKDAEVH